MVRKLIAAVLNMPPKRIFRYLPLAAVLGAVPLVPLAYFTSRNPLYCNHCHKKTHEPELWRNSKVHPVGVTCIDCHATSRGFILRSFSAEPSRINANCLRCHNQRDVSKIGSNGYKFKKNSLNIKIPHDLHIGVIGANCTDCHYNIVHDRREAKTNRPPMEGCLSKCHTADADNCLKCHNPGTVPPPAASALKADTCRDCHTRFMADTLIFHGREYRHARHVESGLLCSNCHSNEVKHGTLLVTPEDCDRCHALKRL